MTEIKIVKIRPDTPGAVELLSGIADIELESFGNSDWGRDGFLKCLENDYDCLIAAIEGDSGDSQDGHVVGFGLVRVLDDAELILTAVAPNERRRRIGTMLLESMMREAASKGAGRMFLEVRAGNLGARRMYEAAGFRRYGIRKDYYHEPPDDAVLMSAELKGTDDKDIER